MPADIGYTTALCTLQHTATHCNTLQHTATHCNTLQHSATLCNKVQLYLHRMPVDVEYTISLCTLQQKATHCNTLQITAIHCNCNTLHLHMRRKPADVKYTLHCAHCNTPAPTHTHARTHARMHTCTHNHKNVGRMQNGFWNINLAHVQRRLWRQESVRIECAHCETLQHTATYCNTLQHTAALRTTLQCTFNVGLGSRSQFVLIILTAKHCNTLHHTTTHVQRRLWRQEWIHIDDTRYKTLQYNCNILQRTFNVGFGGRSPFILIMHTTKHCNTLQHTATHCNILQRTFNVGFGDRSQFIFISFWLCTLQHTVTHCNTLQHNATDCNRLQHNTTHVQRRLWRQESIHILPSYSRIHSSTIYYTALRSCCVLCIRFCVLDKLVRICIYIYIHACMYI